MNPLNDPLYREIVKAKCEDDHLFFTRFFFKQRNGFKFRVNWHHRVGASVVNDIIDGKMQNVVVNIPPGSSKTEIFVINLIARGLAKNPWSRFLHISSSDTLALLNSETARDLVASDEFQAMWPTRIAKDAKAKARWNVVSREGKRLGGVYAVALGGQITGFRGGHMSEGFNGAIIIDDPLKADDSFSKPAKAEANRRLISTVKSRKARPDTPVIVVMQRLAGDDPTAFIKAGNLPGVWHFIEIPALLDDDIVARFGEHLQDIDRSQRDEKGRFSYWQFKEPLTELLDMERGAASDKEGNRLSRFVFAGQYQQSPVSLGGNLIRGEKFQRWKVLPQIVFRAIYADTAMKTEERNDYSVLQCWGLGVDSGVYLLDQVRGKWESPELETTAIAFWNKHKAARSYGPLASTIIGLSAGALRIMGIEDKSSGTGLIQKIRREKRIPVKAIQRNKDKLIRVMDVLPYIEAGLVFIPDSTDDFPWILDFIAECEAFTPDNSHAHDDQIDPMCDAISDMLAKKSRGILEVL